MRCGEGRDVGHWLPGRDFFWHCCFSSYRRIVVTEGKLQATCSWEQHEKAGRLLSLSREIIEATRAATSVGRRWLSLTSAVVTATHVHQWRSKSGKEAELPAFPLHPAGLNSVLVTRRTWRSAALATGQQFSQHGYHQSCTELNSIC